MLTMPAMRSINFASLPALALNLQAATSSLPTICGTLMGISFTLSLLR